MHQIVFGDITADISSHVSVYNVPFAIPSNNVKEATLIPISKNVQEAIQERTESPSKNSINKSWASILKTHTSINEYPSPPSIENIQESTLVTISDLTFNFEPKFLVPRGLVNSGNMCFMNSILQPLVYCPPFANFFLDLSKKYSLNAFKSPLLGAFSAFLNEFRISEKDLMDYGQESPLTTEFIFDALYQLKKFDTKKGRQEDAQEFLGFLLDGLEEELLRLTSVMNGGEDGNSSRQSSILASNEQENWIQIGFKNKPKKTNTSMKDSPISKLFGGSMRSIVKTPGLKDSVTIQPFQSLQLDISPEHIKSISDALHNLTQPEQLHGYLHSNSTNVAQNTTKQVRIETLPPILILHLKRFVYDSESNSTLKLCKFVEYPSALEITMDMMARERKKGDGRYDLTGVIYHHGKISNGGHYTCHVQLANQEWIEMDDTVLSRVSPQDVFQMKKDRQAYMLFYTRLNK